MITVVSWNIGRRLQSVEELLAMDADVALLQEVGPGALAALAALADAGGSVEAAPQNPWEPWSREHYSSWPMVVKLSDRVEVEWLRQVLPSTPTEGDDEIAVSNVGIIAVSMYARWFRPHPLAGSNHIYSDATAHHIMPDLSAFIGDDNPDKHRILAAGDMNNIYGATEDNRLVWYERDHRVFDRMNALGLEFMGPQYPNGRRAEPTPQGLPEDTRNVPTFYTGNQLDHVFASRGFHRGVRAKAPNGVDEWGSSDHCRILIEVDA